MSAIGVQSAPVEGAESIYGTRDPILAATLGNFGFQAMHSLPVLLVVSAANVVALVDRKTGRVEDCAHLEFRFEAAISDPLFGVLKAGDVALAHEIAKLAQKKQTGEISGSESLKLDDLYRKWSRRKIGAGVENHSQTLLWTVQKCYDQITNFLIVSAVTKELSKNPLIEYSKRVFRGVAYAVEPAENEPVAQRRIEKLFRGN